MLDNEPNVPLDYIDESSLYRRTLALGETLFLQDSAAGGLFYLVSGAVNLTRATAAGDSVMIHRARPLDTFAEASLFSEHYHCSAIASADSKLLNTSDPQFYSFLIPILNLRVPWRLGLRNKYKQIDAASNCFLLGLQMSEFTQL